MDLECYKIRTFWDTFLYFDKKSFSLRHIEEKHINADRIPVVLIKTNLENDYLLGVDAPVEDSRWFAQSEKNEWIVRIVINKENSTWINLTNSVGLFASAQPLDPVSQSGEVHVNRHLAAAWEDFELVALFRPSENIKELAEELNLVLENGDLNDPHAVFQFIIDNPRLGSALAPMFAKKDYFKLPINSWTESDAVDKLREVYPQDIWANHALPELCSWLGNGRKSGRFPKVIDESYDKIHKAGLDGHVPSIAGAYTARARELVQPNQDICIIASARNEGIYFIDWIAYHLALGVNRFFIYTNDNTDNSDLLLELLCDNGIINLIHNVFVEGTPAQYKAYAHALQILPETLNYKWSAIIDLDEYITINESKYSTLNDFLSAESFVQVDSIGLSWAMHGSGGELVWDDKPAFLRFNRREQHGNAHIKSIFRPRRFFHSQCHFPYDSALSPRIYKSADSELKTAGPFNDAPNYDHAWISHLFYKSSEEFVVRRLRNRGDQNVQMSMNADLISPTLASWFITNASEELMPAVDHKPEFLEKFHAEREKLLAIPGVVDAEEKCKGWYQQEVKLMHELLNADLRFKTPGSVEAQLLEMLTRKTLKSDSDQA